MNLLLPQTAHRRYAPATWFHALLAPKVRPDRGCVGAVGATTLLAKRQILAVQRPAGVRIECLQGSVWITLDGDARDVVLGAGQAFTTDCPQRALVLALDPACIRCSTRAEALG